MTQVTFSYSPLSVHRPFHVSMAKERVLFGAFGSGKTYAVVAEAIAWCLEQPGIRGVICRYTIPELRDSTEPIFLEMLPTELYQAGELRRSGGHIESFTFPNGSKVLFRSLDDWNKWRSLNLGFLVIDEANEIDEESYQGVISRLRQRDITAEARQQGYTHEITRRGAWMATNPNGHDWIWDRFVDKPQQDSQWYKSTSFDNPYLTKDYLDTLLQYPEPWIRRYVLCEFDDFGGSVYADWQYDTHVIEPIQSYDANNVFWMGMDPGTRSPTAGLWVYMDKEKRQLVGVAEYQGSYTAAIAHSREWRKIEAKHRMNVRWRVADPSIMTTDRGSNMTLHDQYRRLGYNFQLGPRQHKDRIPMLGTLIFQKRFVVTKDCPMTYEAIKRYRWEDLTPAMRVKGETPPEKPLKKDDHLVDCAQYLASRWVAPSKIGEAKPEFSSPLEEMSHDVHRTIRRQMRRNARNRRLGSHDLGSMRL